MLLILFEINYTVLTSDETLHGILKEVDAALKSYYNENFNHKNNILTLLHNLKTKENETNYNEIYKLYKKIEEGTKIQINEYTKKINTYITSKKILEEKIASINNNGVFVENLNEQKKGLKYFLSNLIENANGFIKRFVYLERFFTKHLNHLNFSEEQRKNYDKIISGLETEATEQVDNIDQTWNSIANFEYTNQKFKVKQKILQNSQKNWDTFKTKLHEKTNKLLDLKQLNFYFYSANKETLKNELGLSIEPETPYDLIINYFHKTETEVEKGDLFQQLKDLKTLDYFRTNRMTELDEKRFLENARLFLNGAVSEYEKLFYYAFELIKTRFFFWVEKESEEYAISQVLKQVIQLERELTEITNKPDFLVVRLEQERQLLNKLKEAVALRLGSAFIEEFELIPAFEQKALQDHSYLNFFKEFSFAEKVVKLLSDVEIDKTGLPCVEFSLDDLKSVIVRYEYYLTFPFLLTEDKESVVTPERGTNHYCRSVFANKAESFPLVLWTAKTTSVSVSTEEQPIRLSKGPLFKVPVLVVIVVGLVFIFIIIRFHKSIVFRKHKRKRFAKKQK